jgi:DNA-binding MarR family transcriptional regulator
MQASAVSRTLKSLEDQNLIERTVNKSDRRNTYIMLTEAGGQKRKEIEQRMEEFSKAVFERLDDDDMERLISYLDKLYQVAEEEIEHFAENKSKTQ